MVRQYTKLQISEKAKLRTHELQKTISVERQMGNIRIQTYKHL